MKNRDARKDWQMHSKGKRPVAGRIVLALFALFCFVPAAYAKPSIRVLAELDKRPGNPAVGPDGTIYFSMHPFDGPDYKIMKLGTHDRPEIYPNADVSAAFGAVIGLQVDRRGVLWILDMGNEKLNPKLYGWDTIRNRLHRVLYLPRDIARPNSFFQDFALDGRRNRIYIADMTRSDIVGESHPAFVVVNLETGEMRRVLEGSSFLQPEPGQAMTAEKRPIYYTDPEGAVYPVILGLNPISIDEDGDWIYFGPMTAGKLYRIRAEELSDFSASDAELETKIEFYSNKPASDGILAGKNKVFISDVDAGGIGIAYGGKYREWLKDPALMWADGLAFTSKNDLIVTVNQLNRAPAFNAGMEKGRAPYAIVRIKPDGLVIGGPAR